MPVRPLSPPLLSLIDILYGIAIGIGLSRFPVAPWEQPLGAATFLFTFLVGCHDWYVTHKHYPPPRREVGHFVIQALAILCLSQLFSAAATDQVLWLVWGSAFLLAAAAWNIHQGYPGYLVSNLGGALWLALLAWGAPWLANRMGKSLASGAILLAAALVTVALYCLDQAREGRRRRSQAMEESLPE